MKRLVIIASKRSGFPTSGVGKYILAYVPFFQSAGYIVEYLFQPEKHGLIDGYLWRLFILPRILRKEYRDDIKIFYDESFLTSLRRWMKKTSIVIVHHTYGIETSGLLDKVFKVIGYIGFHFFLRHTSSIITVSHETKKVLEQSNYRKNIPIVCIPNSVSKPEFNPLESLEYLDLPSNKKIILFVASTETRKNVPTAIQVLSQLPEEYILVRVGKMSIGNQQTIIRRMIEKYDLYERYRILSQISEEDLATLYRNSYCLLCTSLYEGFGRPIIEAQMYGLPVVSTISGGLEEVIGDSAIIIHNPLDTHEYVYAIENTIPERKEEFIQKGYDNILKYSSSTLSKDWISILGNL